MKHLFIYLVLLLGACQPNNSKNSTTLAPKGTTAIAHSDDNKIVTELFHRSQLKQQTFTENTQKAFSIKRAATLIKICKKKLSSTEADVNAILKELDQAE